MASAAANCRTYAQPATPNALIKVSPCPIYLGGVAGSTAVVTVTEAGYTGSFSLQSNAPGIAAVPPSDGGTGTFVVQGGAAGSTTIIVSDANGNFATVPVTDTGFVL